jgi:alkylation response protein AidB-like acyl-CoA dehydrogenase
VDFSFTETQQMLKKSARDFLKRECPWTLVKELDESESGFSKKLWRRVSDMGWLGMTYPEEYGGEGSSLTDMSCVYDEMGQVLLPGPYLSSAMICGNIILEAGTEEQKQQLLPDIGRGEKISALALTEPDYGWGPECIHLTAAKKEGDYILNGVKRFVHDAQISDQIICVARTRKSRNPAHGITLFLVDAKSAGLSCRNISAFSGEKLNELTFDAVKVPAANIIGEKDQGWAALSKPLNKATVVLCSYMVGGCQHLLDMTAEYARTRVQFGRPIGAFQWVQSYIIGQANHLEKARWFTYEALWKMDVNKPPQEQDEAVSLAKAAASEAFHECGHLSHEVHAGLGVDKKYPLYLYSKKSKTLYSYLGDPQYHRKRVAKILGM